MARNPRSNKRSRTDATNDADTRRGVFISGGITQGPVIGVNAGMVVTNYYQSVEASKPSVETLASAWERLAQLPLDSVPAYATLPGGSRMPLSKNPLFVGREAELCSLARALKGGAADDKGSPSIAVVTGFGGVGKTQLASEFVHCYGQFFAGGVFWLNFADATSIPAEIAACGGTGRLDLHPNFQMLPLHDQMRLILAAWQSELPRLLVFDNCEDPLLLQRWQPTSGGCRMLVTSRYTRWNPTQVDCKIWLGLLDRDRSIELLRKYRPDLPERDLDAIADELGDLPLALHLAGSFLVDSLRKDLGSPAAYLLVLREGALQDISPDDDEPTFSPTKHDWNLDRTIAISYDQLDAADPVDALARDLLARASYFAPGKPIPRDLLLATLELADADRAAQRLGERALGRLLNLGLLEAEAGEGFRLHRLLAAFVRARATDTQAQEAVERVVLDVIGGESPANLYEVLLTLLPHLRAVTNAARDRQDEQAAHLCIETGEYLWRVGDYEMARPYFERGLTICEQALGSDHLLTARCLQDLGGLLRAQRNDKGARPLLERALAICGRNPQPNHQLTVTILNNLAGLLSIQNDSSAARALLDRAREICERGLGPDHPLLALTLNNLAGLLRNEQDSTLARRLYEQALAIRRKVLGPNHPEYATSLNDLATLLSKVGERAEARQLYEQALEIREQALGPKHLATARSRFNLAALLYAEREYARSRALYEQMLPVYELNYGRDHPEVATCLYNLAQVLRALKDYAAARPHFERSLEIRERELGPLHNLFFVSLNSLAALLEEQGEYEDACKLLKRAVEIREKSLGPDAPELALSLNNLALLLQAQGEYATARPLLEHALAIYERQLGPTDSTTLKVRENLAALDLASDTQ